MDENKFTFENPEYRDTYRHTTSHILAQAVKRLYPYKWNRLNQSEIPASLFLI